LVYICKIVKGFTIYLFPDAGNLHKQHKLRQFKHLQKKRKIRKRKEVN